MSHATSYLLSCTFDLRAHYCRGRARSRSSRCRESRNRPQLRGSRGGLLGARPKRVANITTWSKSEVRTARCSPVARPTRAETQLPTAPPLPRAPRRKGSRGLLVRSQTLMPLVVLKIHASAIFHSQARHRKMLGRGIFSTCEGVCEQVRV